MAVPRSLPVFVNEEYSGRDVFVYLSHAGGDTVPAGFFIWDEAAKHHHRTSLGCMVEYLGTMRAAATYAASVLEIVDVSGAGLSRRN